MAAFSWYLLHHKNVAAINHRELRNCCTNVKGQRKAGLCLTGASTSESDRGLRLWPPRITEGHSPDPAHRSLKALWINLHDRVAADPVLDVRYKEGGVSGWFWQTEQYTDSGFWEQLKSAVSSYTRGRLFEAAKAAA